MGYNTALMLCNDGLDTLLRDPEAGRKIHDGILAANNYLGEGRATISLANHCNPMMALASHHADSTQIVAVGGNMIRPVFTTLMGYHADRRDFQEVILGKLAQELGYHLVRQTS